MTKRIRVLALAAGLALCMGLALVGGTLAYLTAVTPPIVNTFQIDPGGSGELLSFDLVVQDQFNKTITVKNTSQIPVKVRVMLAPIVTKKGQPCGTKVEEGRLFITDTGQEIKFNVSGYGWTIDKYKEIYCAYEGDLAAGQTTEPLETLATAPSNSDYKIDFVVTAEVIDAKANFK